MHIVFTTLLQIHDEMEGNSKEMTINTFPIRNQYGILKISLTAFLVSVPYSTHLSMACTCQNLPGLGKILRESAFGNLLKGQFQRNAISWRRRSWGHARRLACNLQMEMWKASGIKCCQNWFCTVIQLWVLRKGIHFSGHVDVRFNSRESWFYSISVYLSISFHFGLRLSLIWNVPLQQH